MPRRWDDDQRGHGGGDAERLVPGARELVAAFSQADWVAEQPEIHLRPHVEARCQRDPRLALIEANTDGGHPYVLGFEWRGANPSVGEARAAVLSLIGSFAESPTYVRQRRVERDFVTARWEIGPGARQRRSSGRPVLSSSRARVLASQAWYCWSFHPRWSRRRR
jgi:hypothetical protein